MSNLSEEEKKAIEKLSSKKNETTWYDTIRQIKREEITDVVVTRQKYITIILNLIEKQQKELEDKNKVINLMAKGILNIDKEIGQENNRESKVKQTSDEFTEETRYYTPEGEIYETTIKTYKFPKNYISKDKIREKIKELEHEIETNSLYEENWNKIKVLKELLEEE